MKFTYTDGNLSKKADGNYMLLLNIDKSQSHVMESLEKIVDDDKLKSVEIKHFKEKRSLSCNSYMWVILNKMAIKLKSTDEEIYLEMLRKYGTKDFVAALESAEPILKRVYKIVEPIKDSMINDTPSKTYRLIRGSSTYDVEEMQILIDAVVSEAKELGIETMTPNEIAELIEKWGGKNER